MSDLRDFGHLGSNIYDGNVGNSQIAYVDTTRNGQVYSVTHNGEGYYLPFMNRSFISFSFGGKNIEDFNLIATTEGDRLQRTGSSEFEDLVDSYNIIDGQFYWGTHYKPNTFSFKLATDGISQTKLDEFKYWFAGGKTRELILAEHPNRAILARVSRPPEITLLPFEKQVEVLVNNKVYKTSTTVYRGEITLEFVMDEPFWYSKINIFGHYNTEDQTYYDEWTDANGNTINIYTENSNLDVIKIILEDNIPTSGMLKNNMLLGNNIFASMNNSGEEGHIAKYNRRTIFKRSPKWESGTEYTVNDIVYRGMITITNRQVNDEIITVRTYHDNSYKCLQDHIASVENAPDNPSYWQVVSNDQLVEAEIDMYDEIAGEPGEITIYILNDQLNDIDNSDDKLHIQNILIREGVDLSPVPSEEDENEMRPLTMAEWAVKINELLTRLGAQTGVEGYSDLWEDPDQHARIYGYNSITGFTGAARIVGPHMAPDTGIESLSSMATASFYYAGTAPSRPTLEFSITPSINGNGYISTPANSYAPYYDSQTETNVPYSTLTIRSLTTKEFKFTTPNIYTSFNEAMKIFKSLDSEHGGEAWEKIRTLVRDNVKHYAVRAWVSRIIDWCSSQEEGIVTNAGIHEQAIGFLKQFLYVEGRDVCATSSYQFDSSIGKSTGYFKFREYETTAETTSENPMTYHMVEIKEDVSDMLKSGYLVITDRNHPNENGEIVSRVSGSEYTETYSHELYHNMDGNLQNIFVKYKNMYL